MILGDYKRMSIAVKRKFLEWEAEIEKMPHRTAREKRAVLMQIVLCRCTILTASFFPFWTTMIVVSFIAHFWGLYSSVIGSVAVALWMIVDYVMPIVKKPRTEQIVAQNVLIWNQIANYVVCPVLESLLKRDIHSELLYFAGPFVYGSGFYFKLPGRIKDKTSEITLQRKLERKFAELRDCEWSEIAAEKKIRVSSDTIFISEGI